MRKVLLVLIAFIGLSVSAQEVDSKWSSYLTAGLSMGRGDNFQESSYPTLEFGKTHKNISYGFVIGRGNLVEVFNNDHFADYFWEGKISPSYNLGQLTGTVFAGAGAYFDSEHYFTEVGVGLSWSVNSYSYGVSFSNWDTLNYITPSITYNF
jgi:hypothetical protein